jgi:putative flippase GtrA
VLGQGARFILAGGTAVVLYAITTTVLASVIGIPFQVALAIGFVVAITIQFILYRRFVWVHEEDFALGVHHQAGRFLTVAAVNYGATVASTSVLPRALGISTEIVYLVTVATLPVINFLVLRQGIFHPQSDRADPAPTPSTRDPDA